MKISKSKIEYLCINGGNDKETIKMEATKVPRVKTFKYLESTVQESGSCEREVKRRVQAGWNGWKKRTGSNRKSVQFSGETAMVYGLETVAVTKKQAEKMKVAKRKMLRFPMGVTRKDKIRNEYITGTVKVERLTTKMREGSLRWYEHVMRSDQTRRRKKSHGNRVTRKEKKRELEEKISGCSEGGYGGSWCEGEGHWKQDAVEEHHTLWQPLIKRKRQKKKI